MSNMNPLTEEEKVQILIYAKEKNNQWGIIGQIMNRNPETIRKFYYNYQKTKELSPKRGRPITITEEVKNDIIESMRQKPTQSLNSISNQFNVSPPSAKKVLNDNKIKYYRKTAISPLTEDHKQARIQMSDIILSYEPHALPPIIFTDESTICENLEEGGIWREWGHHPPESFFTKEAHPISIMIWGGIGPRGFRTPLLFFNGHVNSQKYVDTLKQNQIFEKIECIFGHSYVWQQDNAPSHRSKFTTSFLNTKVREYLPWPAKSPDLSPIEQVWAYIKKRLAGRKFTSKEELFKAISQEWNLIPDAKLHSYYQSFWARCRICKNSNGESLNGKWKDVKKEHDKYRTHIYYYTDPITKKVFINDK